MSEQDDTCEVCGVLSGRTHKSWCHETENGRVKVLPPPLIEKRGSLEPTPEDVADNDILWLVAKVCHEVNRAYCASLGDYSQPSWEDAPAWQVDSAYNGVMMHFENSGVTPEQSHESWMAEKIADGWTYDRDKNESKKTHPCILPYARLPKEHQTKDALFGAVCQAFFGSQ